MRREKTLSATGTNYEFHLQQGSAAIDTGVYLAEVAIDKDGNPRPMDGDNDGTAEYDIGAYEYTGTYTPVLQITTTSLPNGTVGLLYSQTLQATGGTPPYSWSIISGTLPDGLSLNSSNGEISGTPTTEGAYNFTIQVTDSDTNTDTQALSISVSDVSCSYSVAPPTIKSFESSGGEGSVSVSVPSSCAWTASSGASWITITSGSSGSGNGTVNYSVAANSNATSRTGTMTIAGKTFTVYQSSSFGNLTMPVPIGQRGFPYDPTTIPEASTNPAEAMPIGVGDVATGGDTLNIQIGLGQFSAPVDVYGAYMLSTDPDNMYILNPDLTFQVFSVEEIVQALTGGVFPAGIKPWLENTIGPIDKPLFNMPTSGLPPGTYYLYLLITPAGSLDNYYLWRTYFEVVGV